MPASGRRSYRGPGRLGVAAVRDLTARRRQSRLRRRRQTAVDDGKAERDQAEAGKVAGSQAFAEDGAPSRIAVAGASSVTSTTLIAPAPARMRK